MPIILDKPISGGGSISGLWDTNSYTMANSDALSRIHPDMTFSDVAGGIQIVLADGMLSSTSPFDTVTSMIVWDMKDSITKAIRSAYSSAPGIQGFFNFHLAVDTYGATTQSVDITLGHTTGTTLTAVACGGGFRDGASPRSLGWRNLTSTYTEIVDASPSGVAVAWSYGQVSNIGTGALITGNTFTYGLITTDPAVQDPGGPTLDTVTANGNVGFQRYMFLSVRLAGGLPLSGPVTYVVKPRLLLIGWDT